MFKTEKGFTLIELLAVIVILAVLALIATPIVLKLVNNGFVRARGVVVFPESYEREAVVQGILCPTVYNVGDRFNNAPFAQASWFSRPNAAFDYERSIDREDGVGGTDIFEDSPKALFSDNLINSYDKSYINVVNYGSWAEFRHNKPIPDNGNRNAEIQCISSIPDGYPYSNLVGSELRNDINKLLKDNNYETITFTDVHDINPYVHIKGYIPTSGDVTYDEYSGLVTMANLCVNHVLVRYRNQHAVAEGQCDI